MAVKGRLFWRKVLARTFCACWLIPICSAPAYAAETHYVEVPETHYSGNHSILWFFADGDEATGRLAKVRIQDKEFVIEGQTKAPSTNSVFLLEHSQVNQGEWVLDMGTGTGVHAIFAADKAARVVATDIDPSAIENAKHNAALNGVADKIDFRVGDLFGSLTADDKFDVIYLNVAYPFDSKTMNRWQLHERFFADVRKHMKPNARIYYQIGFLANIPYATNMINRNGLRVMRLLMMSEPYYQREPIMMLLQEFADAK